ncbi:MAG TPA: ANTAR domain-containing protein [Amycolatopsis sp.]|nr:ANTAR domain-containing protein [Amycolatopsis sp.]
MARDLPHAVLDLADIAEVGSLDGYADRLARWSVELAPVAAAAVVLRDDEGTLRVCAAWPDWIRALPEAAIAGGTGLATECCARAEPVWADDVTECDRSTFRAMALRLGIRGAYAAPVLHSEKLFGALGVYYRDDGGDRAGIEHVCAVLAEGAGIGLANMAEYQRLRVLAGQLQSALESRVVIEQAKGILAERRHIDVNQAFSILRRLARENNLRLHDVARTTVQTLTKDL